MYYVCNTVTSESKKICGIEVCDTSDGIVNYIPLKDFKNYKNIQIDGVSDGKIRISDYAKEFKKKCSLELMKRVLAGGLSGGYDKHNKCYINLVEIILDYGEETDKITYNNNPWMALNFEIGLVFNLRNDNNINLVCRMFVSDNNWQGDYVRDDFQVLDVPVEFIKTLYDNASVYSRDSLIKVLSCYFLNLGRLCRMSIGTRDYHIHKDIRKIRFDDERLDITISFEKYAVEV